MHVRDQWISVLVWLQCDIVHAINGVVVDKFLSTRCFLLADRPKQIKDIYPKVADA